MRDREQSVISEEEVNYINEYTKEGTIYIQGFLSTMRKECLTLEEVYQQAVSEPLMNKTQIAAVNDAKDFLSLHAKQLKIEINPVE